MYVHVYKLDYEYSKQCLLIPSTKGCMLCQYIKSYALVQVATLFCHCELSFCSTDQLDTTGGSQEKS